MASEYGWLIERQENGRAKWMTYKNGFIRWTADSVEALRFARRIDASDFADGGDEDVTITEHQWGLSGPERHAVRCAKSVAMWDGELSDFPTGIACTCSQADAGVANAK